jgi:hypothetical protein
MEVRDGFIVGVFNYCDRWCETCALTSRCRLFADAAEAEAALDPGLKAIVDAPLLPQDVPPPPPQWLQELFDEMNAAMTAPAPEEGPRRRRAVVPFEHEALNVRARQYGNRVRAWLRARDTCGASDGHDARAVVGWFHTLIPAKIARAVQGLADDDPEDRDWPADHDGSAKVALLGIARSHGAWLQLVESGAATRADVAPLIADLVWLGEALERVFPNARAFVRPGFDEPEELAKLR